MEKQEPQPENSSQPELQAMKASEYNLLCSLGFAEPEIESARKDELPWMETLSKRVRPLDPYHVLLQVEIENALKSYAVHYNKLNDKKIEFRILSKVTTKEQGDLIAIGVVAMEFKIGGLWESMSRKTFGFRHTRELDTEDWKTPLLRELLMEIVGMCTTYYLKLKQIKQIEKRQSKNN